VSFGAEVRYQKIMDNPRIGTTAYLAGFQKGDKILKIGGFTLNDLVTLDMVLDKYKVDDKVMVMFQRYNKIKEVEVSLKTEKLYDLSLMDADSTTGKMVQNRAFWLHLK